MKRRSFLKTCLASAVGAFVPTGVILKAAQALEIKTTHTFFIPQICEKFARESFDVMRRAVQSMPIEYFKRISAPLERRDLTGRIT